MKKFLDVYADNSREYKKTFSRFNAASDSVTPLFKFHDAGIYTFLVSLSTVDPVEYDMILGKNVRADPYFVEETIASIKYEKNTGVLLQFMCSFPMEAGDTASLITKVPYNGTIHVYRRALLRIIYNTDELIKYDV